MDSIIIDIKNDFHFLEKEKYIEIINEKYDIDYLANNCKTISHEILTSFNNRIERKFV